MIDKFSQHKNLQETKCLKNDKINAHSLSEISPVLVLRNYQERKNLRHRKCNNKKRELSIFRKIIPQFFYLMNEQTDFENISLPLR